MKTEKFAAFILTHGRPNDVITYNTLRKHGYTGNIYLIIDNTDKSADKYFYKYGPEQVIMFDKQKIALKTDQGDNFNDLRTTTHVRNAIFEIAEEMGIEYFIQLDDDYGAFHFRYIDGLKLAFENIKDLNSVFDSMVNFIKSTTVTSICMAQGGDFIGGANNEFVVTGIPKRKAMNSFVCSTKRKFMFFSRLNEDVNTYLVLGSRGVIFLTTPLASLVQSATQGTKGGMTETYLDNGTYQKSFFSVMYCPAFVQLALIGNKTKRIHHHVDWEHAVPCIIDDSYKKLDPMNQLNIFEPGKLDSAIDQTLF